MTYRPILIGISLFFAIFLLFCIAIFAVVNLTSNTSSFTLGPKIGMIQVVGTIESSEKIVKEIIRFRKADAIKAIVVRVDSPGGGVGPSQEIYEEIKVTASAKPVIISMGSVAASGGYYISAPATRIFANPGTITGSIGVIMGFTQYKTLLDKIGLSKFVIKSGAHKDIGSAVREMTDEERGLLQAMIDDVHDQFVTAIAEGRSLDPDKVRKLADGRLFSGRQALKAGLVDELGTLQNAIATAASLAHIDGEPNLVYPESDSPHLWDYLIEETVAAVRKIHSRASGGGLQFLWKFSD